MELKKAHSGDLEAAKMALESAFEVGLLADNEWSEWDRFVENHEQGSIHQTVGWGRFQASKGDGWKFWVIVARDQGKIVAGSLILRRVLPFGKCWLYAPQGPLVNYFGEAGENQMKAILKFLKDFARKEKAVYLRVEPCLTVGWKWKKLGFRGAHAHYQPENTLMVDLDKPVEDILAQMKPKGRYNIKLAEKKGVTVRSVDAEGDFQLLGKEIRTFSRLLAETTTRDGFAGHDERYYMNMLLILKNTCRLYLADFGGDSIAAIIVTFFKDRAIYYFGASGSQHRNLMAPYLLQWEAMMEARNRKIKWYDLLGVAPEGNDKHAWAGVTEFKLKFGGERIDYFPGQEMVYKPVWFALMKARKWLSRKS